VRIDRLVRVEGDIEDQVTAPDEQKAVNGEATGSDVIEQVGQFS
jgi:hypothetical protein